LKKSFLLHILKWGNKKVILNITLQRTNNFLTLIHPTIMQISSKALRKVIMKIYQINRLKETLIIQTLRINFLKKVMLLKLHILQIHNLMDPIATLIHQCIKLLKNSFLNFLKIHTKVSVTIILLISKRSEIRKTVSNFFQKIMDFLATLIILIFNLILH
jgi:ribosomal protein S24E